MTLDEINSFPIYGYACGVGGYKRLSNSITVDINYSRHAGELREFCDLVMKERNGRAGYRITTHDPLVGWPVVRTKSLVPLNNIEIGKCCAVLFWERLPDRPYGIFFSIENPDEA